MKHKSSLLVIVGAVCRAVVAFGLTFTSVIWLVPLLATGTVALAATTPSFIQERDRQVTSGTTNAVSLASPTTAGNLLAVYVIWDNRGSVSISDTRGNPYASAVVPVVWNAGRYSAQVFYAKKIKGGADTVIATFASAVHSFGIVYVHEYSGLDQTAPVDVTAAAVGSFGSLNSGSVTTTNANDLLFGAGVSMNVVTGAGPGYTARSTAQGNITEDRNVSAKGSYNATASNSAGGWGMQIVAFRAASGTSDTTPPTVPTAVSAIAASSSQINLSWTASTDPDNTPIQLSYGVYRKGTRIGTTSAGTTSWQDTGLSQATAYSYTVSAQDPAGNSSAQSASVQVTTPPSAPSITSFTAIPGAIIAGQTATLAWATSNATSLTINNGVGTVTSLTSTVARPAASTTYILTASNSTGSVTAQATVAVSSDTVPPSVPTLNAAAVSASQINLNWAASTDNVGVAGYKIYRNGASLAQTAATAYSDTGLTTNTTYTYTVSAFDAAGNTSAQSAPASATTSGSDNQNPTVSITSPGNNQAVAGTWTVTANAADNVGVAGVQFTLDGATLGAETSTAPYSTAWNTMQVADGTHVVAATARDAAGNTATSTGITVTVGNSSRRPYITTFPVAENPISEGGNWINGKAVGLDWADVQTKPEFAFGTESGTNGYDDSTALLTGTWGPDQTAQATVHLGNVRVPPIYEEVELRLRSAITAHNNTGYEINFQASSASNAYVQIVRWNGPLGNFTYVTDRNGPGLHDGDVIKATIQGSTITVYLNGTQILQGTDSTYATGAPGMGFFLQGATGLTADYGFTSFTASDGSTTDITTPSVPTNLAATAISSSQINLSWTASTDDVGVSGYQIFRNTVPIASPTTASFSDTGLTPNTQYVYAVSALDAAGHSSSQTAPVTATTPGADITPPSVPVNIQSSNVTSTSLTIAWSASTDNVAVAGYQIFRNGSQVATIGAPTYADSGLLPNVTYSYTIAAYDYSNNVSNQSVAFLVTTTAGALTPPSFVQVNRNQIGQGTSVSVAFNAATIRGNTIVAYVIWDNTGGVALADTRGDSFVKVSAPSIWSGKYSAQVFYATNVVGGSDTITATFQTSVNSFGVIYVHEYAGISVTTPVDVTVAASGSSTLLNSGSAATTSANDLIFGAGVSDNVVSAAGSGFIARDLAFGNITEDRIAGSTGSYSATATHNGSMWAMQMVAFRAAN